MSAIDDYQSATEALATDTERAALAIYNRYLRGELSDDDAALLIAAAVNRANAAAVSLADAWLTVQVEEQLGEPVPTVGVLPVDDSERLVKAVNTVLSEPASPEPTQDETTAESIEPAQGSPTLRTLRDDQAEARLARLARCEPLEAAQQATHEAMQKQPLVEGWVRHMDADPCQLCRWWWREGRVWPKAHRMPTHKGCNCQPRIVLVPSVRHTQFTRRLERANAPTGTRFERYA